MELLKLLTVPELIAQTLTFIILLVLMRVFAWKPILAILDKRRQRIVDELKAIDQKQKEIDLIKQEYKAKLDAIEDEAKERITQAVNQARDLAGEIKKNAHSDADKIISSGREMIRHEISLAKEEIKTQIVSLAVSVAEHVIEEKLTEVEDKKLINDFLNSIEEIK